MGVAEFHAYLLAALDEVIWSDDWTEEQRGTGLLPMPPATPPSRC